VCSAYGPRVADPPHFRLAVPPSGNLRSPGSPPCPGLLLFGLWASANALFTVCFANEPASRDNEEFAADGYTHIECFCPRCRVIRLRPASASADTPSPARGPRCYLSPNLRIRYQRFLSPHFAAHRGKLLLSERNFATALSWNLDQAGFSTIAMTQLPCAFD